MTKHAIKKWTLRLTATIVLIFGMLVGLVLNPSLLYANKTVVGNFTVYHTGTLDKSFVNKLESVSALLKVSELYRSDLKLKVCLNDGSFYPTLMEKLRGQAFGWGFADIIVLMGRADIENNYLELNGYKWNLIQLVAHEGVHCLQFAKLGLLHSNPIANYPNWKWEGYAEFISRNSSVQEDLKLSIGRLREQEQLDKNGWAILLQDSTISPKEYYRSWLMNRFCIEIEKKSFADVLSDSTSENLIWQQMIDWAN
jgi:hypothetical protein